MQSKRSRRRDQAQAPPEGESESLVSLAEDGVRAVLESMRQAFGRSKPSPAARLLAKRAAKRRAWRNHAWAYSLVSVFLLGVNALTWAMAGGGIEQIWWPYAAGGWGIGVGMHWVNYRGWLRDHRKQLAAAEMDYAEETGLLPENDSTDARTDAGPPDPERDALAARVTTAMSAASTELQKLGPRGAAALAELERARRDMDRLFEGDRRLQAALCALAPRGVPVLDQEIAALDAKIVRAQEPRLRRAYESNHAMMVGLATKARAIAEDRERIRVVIEGFCLAAKGLHGDAARLGASSSSFVDTSALQDPARMLSEEVEILREVEAELERL